MKKILIPISTLLVTGLAHAQVSTTENYVYTKSYLDYNGTTPTKTSETVQYFDGLGRPKQVVGIKASPSGKDVVTHIEYDGFGRQVKDYLPIPQSQTLNGAIVPNPLGNSSAIYGSEKIFSEKVLENSPLDRLQQQIQVGNDWANKPVKFDYEANIDGEVKKYVATFNYSNFTSSITLSGNYGGGQLYKNTVTDEDGNKTIEFKNGQGQILLVRKVNGTENVDTYYVYNDYNQLAYVIPPLASVSGATDETTLNNLCYQYKYDGRNRLAEKKLPGKGWEYMVYDKADRLILTQDANLREKGQWLMSKYDKFGRVILTALIKGLSRTEWDNILKYMVIAESRNAASYTVNSMNIYYTNDYFVPDVQSVLSVNYYDTYPSYSFNPTFPTSIENQPVLTDTPDAQGVSTKSLPVMSLVKNIEDDNWTKNYTYYDTRGRAVGSYSINHLGGRTKVDSKLDFSGLVQKSVTTHKRLDTDIDRVITENFTYDNGNRLLTHTHQVDNNAIEYLAQNEYNELSQLKNKKVGGVNTASPLQSIDYAYNIRGWMTKINDPDNLGNDLFGYKINYTQVEGLETPNLDYPNLQVKPKYNGNIAEVSWKTLTQENEPLKRYGYAYDGLNRLSAGFYQKAGSESAGEYFEKLDYDLNGNISRLKRSEGILAGTNIATVIDNLKYDYSGNRLIKITDEQQNPSGYPYLATPNPIGYDVNGNMINHLDKGISDIQYNFLNLPKQITQNTNVTKHVYRADGVKVKKLFGELETDYLDGFQYKSTKPSEANSGGGFVIVDPNEVAEMKLRIIPTSEGYYDALSSQYIYNFTDHLGNVRLSYSDTSKDGVIQPRQYKIQQCEGAFKPPFQIPVCLDYWKPGEIVEVNNYYPFGLLHNYTATTQNAYQYKYNGKELQETGQYDYGARFYMPDVGRWGVVDPKSELGRRFSPYNYAFDNPIMFIDPDGMWPWPTWGQVKNFASGYAKGAWSTAGSMAKGAATSTYTSVTGGVREAGKVYNAYQTGGAKAAVKQYGQSVYETSGAKAIVQTAKGVAKGDAKSIGSAVVMVTAAAITHKVSGGKASTLSEVETTTLHRGVNSTSPAYSQAVEGTATPRGGNATPLEHNTVTTESNYTSWSTNPAVAENFALRTSGEGVVLTADIPNSQLVQSPNLKSVNLVQSPGTIVSESETLVKGTVTGADVKKVNLER